MTKLNTLLATLLLAGTSFAGTSTCTSCTPTAPVPTGSYANTVFAGYDFRHDSYYMHGGIQHDLNGNMGDGGLYLRAFTGFGSYNYDTIPGAGHTTGQLFDADLGLGYRLPVGSFVLGAYAGAHLRDRNLTAIDPANPVGTDWGARFVLDAHGSLGAFDIGLIGQYSTIENAIWTRARVGYKVCERVTVGPEFIYLNDAQFNERRVGGFIKIATCPMSALTLAAGYADYSGRGTADTSMYGSVGFSVNF
ncbi:MAG: cellulose biosynthesis protein BcsS [Verrucomicrobiaceae bacterium]|nr:cellulose biosynthesis protein BcsS [Verrucomicrobiaceae bacterium]